MNSDSRQFAGKVAVITGASRGIGSATARELSRRGARTLLIARSEAPLEELAEELRASGGEAVALVADLTDGDELERLAKRIGEQAPRLDVLVNNAGVLPRARRLERMSRGEWQRTLDLNLTAAWQLSACARELMTAGGVIVNVSSVAARFPSVGLGAYCVSKVGLEMLTKAAALEWAPEIRVVGVMPGKVDTQMVAPILEYSEAKEVPLNLLDRVAPPQEVANLIAYLASDEAASITGSSILVDGGESIATTH